MPQSYEDYYSNIVECFACDVTYTYILRWTFNKELTPVYSRTGALALSDEISHWLCEKKYQELFEAIEYKMISYEELYYLMFSILIKL